jgi:hypothetical protein
MAEVEIQYFLVSAEASLTIWPCCLLEYKGHILMEMRALLVGAAKAISEMAAFCGV